MLRHFNFIPSGIAICLLTIILFATPTKAQTVNIEGYTASKTENGYPLFEVAHGTITVTSTSGRFDSVLIDEIQIAENHDSYWSSFNLNVTPYSDGNPHLLQLQRGDFNYGTCYFLVSAAEQPLEGIYYTIKGQTAVVTAATLDIETADISEVYVKDGISYPVTSIGERAFNECSKLKRVNIPNSIVTIGDFAFIGCAGLKSVTIPESVTDIGNSAFSETGLTTLEFNARSCTTCGSAGSPAFPPTISSLTIGNNVSQIPAYFLSNGSQIESLNIPNSIVSIGNSAFLNPDSRLKSLTLGSGIEKIDNYAFSSRPYVSYQYVISKVFWLGNTPPAGYDNIEAHVNYVSNDQYSLPNELKYQFLSSKFSVDGIVYIPVSPSDRICDIVDCEYLAGKAEVNLSNRVVNRGVEMTVRNINPYSFYDNDRILTLTLENDGDVGDAAFYGCDALEHVRATNAGAIGEKVFYGCNNLLSAIIQSRGALGTQAFYDLKSLSDLKLGKEITGILSECFYNCSSLEEMNIPDSVIELGQSAFQNCSSIRSISLGKGVTSLPMYIFAGCSSLESLNLPTNIERVDNYAFSGCALSKLIIEEIEQTKEEDGTAAGQNFPDWTSTNHSDRSTSEKKYTFNVEAGDILTFNYTVSSEEGFDFLTVKLNEEQIVRESGSKTGNYKKVFETPGSMTLYMAYEKDGFGKNGKDEASVTDIWLNGTPSDIDYLVLGSNGDKPLFSECGLKELFIGRRLSYKAESSSGYSPFYGNSTLESVEITDAETQIYDREFYGCRNLSFVKVGNGVKAVGKWAFSGCSALNYFLIGEGVESIGEEAFSDCLGLSKFYSYAAVPPYCGEQALDDIDKWECALYVPNKSADEYRKAPQWKDFFFIEEMDAILVAEIRLNVKEINLKPNETVLLTAQIIPSNASDKTILWSSSDPNVADVNSDGLVTAVADGTAVITAKSGDGNSEATCIVTVDKDFNGIDSIFVDARGQIEVYNLSGNRVSHSTENLPPGIYIVKKGNKTHKISIQ